MNIYIRKYLYVSLASAMLLVMTFSAYAVGISTGINNNVAKIGLLSKDEDIDKNITNVKVNYNPVAAQISVSLKIAKQSIVVIKLMDALGNEILNLSNTTMEPGSHNLSFDKDDKVAAGFYFLRVSSGDETVVKRISIR